MVNYCWLVLRKNVPIRVFSTEESAEDFIDKQPYAYEMFYKMCLECDKSLGDWWKKKHEEDCGGLAIQLHKRTESLQLALSENKRLKDMLAERK
jgi:hypothetical protein